jgi:hypothetical protein
MLRGQSSPALLIQRFVHRVDQGEKLLLLAVSVH